MKFAWLVRVHSWVNSIVFGNNWLYRTTAMGETVLQNQFFGFKADGRGVFEEKTNLKAVFGTLFPDKKVIFIFVVRRPFPKNGHAPHKINFSLLFWKIYFFEKVVK